ncbi:MAG: endonuclease/exonuclease/phosphatase family protein [Firmicutes bacterium]|nr:endonuclease/exonuclease/phosphatase family protein [Bacillota bacterium]
MKLVTFNIRCDFGQDGDNCFVCRKPLVKTAICEHSPDIICFQEVLPHVAAWLKETFPEYALVGTHRSVNLEDEATFIMYKKSVFNLVAADTFWLSPQIRTPGSRFPTQSECPRAVTEALLEDISTPGVHRVFRVMSLHLDHMSADARVSGLEAIFDKVSREELFAGAAVIIAGDFNADVTDTGTPEGRIMARHPEYECMTAGVPYTYHEYGKKCERIDFIFRRRAGGSELCKTPCRVGEPTLWHEEENGVYLSDHCPVEVRFEFEE